MKNSIQTTESVAVLPKQIIGDLIRGLAAKPDKVVVNETSMSRSVTFSVRTDHVDYGRVVGAKARNFYALEMLVKMMAAREEKEGRLSVVPPPDHSIPKPQGFKANPGWGKAQLLPLVKDTCKAVFERGGAVNVVDVDGLLMNVEIRIAHDEVFEVVSGEDRVSYILQDHHELDLTVATVESALKTIFNAIGKTNGRNICLDLVQSFAPVSTK